MQLGRQNDLAAEVVDGFAHDALVVPPVFRQQVRPIGFGGVEEGAAEGVGPADGLDAVISGWNFSVAVAEAHTAHADGRHFDGP